MPCAFAWILGPDETRRLKAHQPLIPKELFIVMLLGASFIVFVILYASPWQPLATGHARQVTGGSADGLKSAFLQATWLSQYLTWLTGILRGVSGNLPHRAAGSDPDNLGQNRQPGAQGGSEITLQNSCQPGQVL